MLGGVAVVTDSTADLPMDLAERLGLRVVPMTVSFGDESFISGVTLQTDEFYERLAESEELPTTSQPVAAWFEEAYGDAGDEGAEAIVSIHLSSELSGTSELACVAGRQAPIAVTCVDSRQVGGSLALAVLAAQHAAEGGAGAEEVADAARRVAEQTRLSFAVDSLDYLRKG
ncbi:MAG: DegV family protein, partial [Nitriliruptorales bacterium]